MTGAELITTIRAELVEDVAGLWTDAMLLRWINDAEKDFVNRTRILEGTATLSLQAGRIDYPFPNDLLSVKSAWVKVVNADSTYSWQRLMPTTLEKMGQEQADVFQNATTARNTPRKYWIWDRHFYVHPAPDTEAQEILVFFKRKPTPLTATTASLNVDDTLADAIKAYVLWKAWKKEQEHELAAEAKADYMNGVRDGLRWVKKQTGDFVYSVDMRSSRALAR